MDDSVLMGNIPYVKRDVLFETEKSFVVDFPLTPEEIKQGARHSNRSMDPQLSRITHITDVRDFDLNTHGFCIIQAKPFLEAEEALKNPDKIKDAYFAEIERLLHDHFPEYKRIECTGLVTRKRDQRYPSSTFIEVSHEQPSMIAHSDYSHAGAYMDLYYTFPGQERFFDGKDFDMLNVWRPLAGPNNDWPLVLCDWTSVDQENDLLVSDLLHRDREAENVVLHANPAHRWYYLRDQQPEDVIVFRCMDSSGKRARCFHCAVDNADAQGPPRQSVEIRAVALR